MFLHNVTELKKTGTVVASLMLLILSLLYFFLIHPQQLQMERLIREYEQEKHSLAILEQFGRDYPDIDKQLSLLDKKIEELNRILPNTPGMENLLVYIKENIQKYHLQLISLAPGKVVEKTLYNEYKIEIIFRGEYFATMNFIKNLEDGPRFVSLKAISLTEREGLIDVKLEMVVFGIKESLK